MGHDWILDVLSDLQNFAHANEMPTLAAQLSDASYVAQAELASKTKEDSLGVFGANAKAGQLDRTVGVG